MDVNKDYFYTVMGIETCKYVFHIHIHISYTYMYMKND